MASKAIAFKRWITRAERSAPCVQGHFSIKTPLLSYFEGFTIFVEDNLLTSQCPSNRPSFGHNFEPCLQVCGGTYAVSATEAATLWRGRQTSVPELQKARVPNKTRPGR